MPGGAGAVVIEGSTSSFAPDIGARVPSGPRLSPPEGWAATPMDAAHERIALRPNDDDLTRQASGKPIGQRIVLHGRVLDSAGNPIPGVLLEIWQCNGAGAYRDPADPGANPLDPNFIGAGRVVSDAEGRYEVTTIRPGAYPGPPGSGIPYRPAHIHFSIIGPDLASRVMTQCYFEGDPLIERDFVVQAMPNPEAQPALVARYDEDRTVHWAEVTALGYKWDIVLAGRGATPMEW